MMNRHSIPHGTFQPLDLQMLQRHDVDVEGLQQMGYKIANYNIESLPLGG